MVASKKTTLSVKEAFYVPLEFVFSNQFIIDFKRLNAMILKFKENEKT